MKRFLSIIAGFGLCLIQGLAQDISVSGIVNHYLMVDSVLADRVLVVETSELAYFQPGDKILIIQMTGAELYDENDFADFETRNSRSHKTFNNVGKFEVLQLDEVVDDNGDKYVVFTDNLSNSYDQGEKIQLVRFVEGETVTVTGLVTAKDWDGSTGGIVAIIGTDSIKLNANIDVSNKGFRGGAVPTENYTAGCRQDISGTILDTLYFLPSQLNRSGNKGEGIITASWPYTKGIAFNLNGGGAGNGLFSGGGGGSNYNPGGDGGQQSSVCVNYLTSAWGGYGSYLLYTAANRQVIMGGGGGSGVKSSTATASAGGDGGGIVMLVTGVLSGNGRSILANGQSSAAATGSGGGGGAGGTILVDATGYENTFAVYSKGGTGGRTDANCTGSGGGGSGGVLWHAGTSIPVSVADLAGGAQGYVALACAAHTGSGGYAGSQLSNLLMPLTGFLFNTIRGVDTVCAGQVPNLITGSQPKGGDGFYSFAWEQTTDLVNWISAAGTADLTSFQPDALFQTTWFRRIVNSAEISDTSRLIEVFVYPAITSNMIAGTDTLCYGSQAEMLTGLDPAGGSGAYVYQWQISGDLSGWSNTGSQVTSNNPFDPGILTSTSHYRRIISSTIYCSDTSSHVTLTVLPAITGNQFVTADTTICENLGPGLLNATAPGGGDGTYAYAWQDRTTSGTWQDIPSSDVIRYDPGLLVQTMIYRRIVYSGNDNACIDTSATVKTVNVLPALSNNLLESDSSRYCAGDVPLAIDGLLPSGGSGSYAYAWQVRDAATWEDVPGATDEDYTPSSQVVTDTEYRRIVLSGQFDACIDTSDAFLQTVIPYIFNTIEQEDQIICQNTVPLPFNALPATGGFGGVTYEWMQQQYGSSAWVTADGQSDLAAYAAGQLTDSMLYVRKVMSDICTSISDTAAVAVYPVIGNNIIAGDDIQYACFNTAKPLAGAQPTDGKQGDYAYQWEESDNGTDWITAAELPNDQMNYQTGSLTQITYFRRIVLSSATGQECRDTSDILELRINSLPSGDVISVKDTLCAGETLNAGFTVSGTHAPFDVQIGNGTLSQTLQDVSASPGSMPFILNSDQQFMMLSVADDSGCYADLTVNTGLIEAVVYQVPVANAGTDQEVCGVDATLNAVKSISGSTGSWSAAGASFNDIASPVSQVTMAGYGQATLVWTETNWQCTDDDEMVIICYEQPQVPDAGQDQVLDFTYATQMEALPPAVGEGMWEVISGSADFNDETAPSALVTSLDEVNILRWSVTNGICETVSDDVEVSVQPLKIRKAFTPNGDGRNDFFDVGAVNAERIGIKVFNITGSLVFESDIYSEGNLWDGRNMSGVELPEGTYFYVVDIKLPGRDREVQFRSFVEILR